MHFDNIDAPADEALLGGAVAGQEGAPAQGQAAGNVPQPEMPETGRERAEPMKDADKDRERSQHIPRERFDEVNAKLKAEREAREALQSELEAMRQPGEDESPDVMQMEWMALEALRNGDADTALAIRAHINAALLDEAEQRAEQRLAQHEHHRELAGKHAQFQDAVAKTLQSYPMLDSATGNPDAIDEVVAWRDFYIDRGVSWHDALVKAVDKVMPNWTDTASADARRANAMRRNAAASGAQPAAPEAGIGTRSGPMTKAPERQEEWEKLSAAERDRLLA